MRALHNIHSALRPGGLLLDIHPEPKHPWLEVRTDTQTIRIGQLDVSFRTGTVFAARAALQDVIDAHLFARECEAAFIFTYHFASIEAWLRHMGAHWSSARIPAGVAEQVSEMLSSGASELCIPREIHAGRLRRL